MAQPIPLPLCAAPPRVADPAPAAAGASMDVLCGPADRPRDPRSLGQILIEDGAVDPGDLLKATVIGQGRNLPLVRVLLAQGMVTPEAMARALARQWRTSPIDPAVSPADPRLIAAAGPGFCLTHGILPWRRIGGVTWIATARPEAFAALLDRLPRPFGQVRMLLCTEAQAEAGILASSRIRLIRAAETCVPAAESCRSRDQARIGRIAVLALILAVAAAVLAPGALVGVLTGWAVVTLLAQSGLKLACMLAAARIPPSPPPAAPEEGPLPVISVMVPLFHEKDVADRLVVRLARLTYPRDRTDIVLVLEAGDHVTEAALKDARLPHWMRVVRVPDGPVKTKPRALNYALNFCRGQIVGIWDAEDRPEPDQLHKVARRFREAPADVACLQGVLDYYNPRTNWLARCFTVEYAAWFRLLLPGVARLGLVVPLGGTTLFFRRPLLERVGAWDAWNVTEDADLGVRLARRGLRTEILDTTTDEEANCRPLPWIRQRSRWLKGYAMTWAVHMRDPRALYRDLGARRFWGFQVQFLATLSNYLLAPILWSFWLLTLGLPHPLREPLHMAIGAWAVTGLFALFVASEALSVVVGLRAVRGARHRHLMPWVPTLHLYYPLGCLAGWKAIYEVVARPFYWDKTAHGLYAEAAEPGTRPEAPAPGLVSLPLLGRIGDRPPADPVADLAAGRPDAALSNAALSDGALSDGAMPDGTLSDGALSDAALPNAALSDAALSDGALSNGGLSDAALSDSALSDAAFPDAALSGGALSDGAPAAVATGPAAVPPTGRRCALPAAMTGAMTAAVGRPDTAPPAVAPVPGPASPMALPSETAGATAAAAGLAPTARRAAAPLSGAAPPTDLPSSPPTAMRVAGAAAATAPPDRAAV